MSEPPAENTGPLSEDSQPSLTTTNGVIRRTCRRAKGKLIDVGVSGIVELLANGDVVKSAWPGEDKDSEEDMAREAHVYHLLFKTFGAHKRFVKFLSYDETDYSITMEYMANGTLRSYLEAHHDRISTTQRHQWICELAEGMELLHSANIVHCDFSPRNMLLDETLGVKVADFGCVSINGSKSSAGGSVRFYPPRLQTRELIEPEDDLFALGSSSIYEVVTGKPPYVDLDTEQIQCLYRLDQFPDLAGLDFSDIIRDCWLLRAQSARHVHQRLLKVISPELGLKV